MRRSRRMFCALLVDVVLIEIDPQGIEALDDRKDLMDIVGDWYGIGVDKEPLVAVAVEDIAVHNENVFVCAV
ncbi:MAG TPA: hypothetical protein EYQ18_01445 [Candidatus Handelsmanbacteria bacterium]|nr:hypothetical protein [Candidatus Handelsmanbacteria bacterium]